MEGRSITDKGPPYDGFRLARGTMGHTSGWPLAVGLLILEASLCVTLVAIYKKDQSLWGTFLTTNPGYAFVIGILGLCVSTAMVGYLIRQSWASARKEIYFTLIMNTLFLLVSGAGGELMVRLLKTQTADGREQIRNKVLLPKNWERTRRHYQEVWEKAAGDLTYLAYDAQLGWVVGDGRQSENGLYRSGASGIRTREVRDAIERQPGKTMVALVGDSYTFGEEVTYEDTWAVQLQHLLGDEFQVINFGVPGYGVDQIYLRYLRDVRSWNPDIVIFGFISNDLLRSMTVYTFLSFPEWDSPYSKPRFVQAPTGLKLVNSPTVKPEDIFSAPLIFDLPALADDAGYRESEWIHEWIHHFDLVRFVQARFPRWARLNDQPTDESVLALNRELVRMFLGQASENGSRHLLAYLPSSEDFWAGRDKPTLGQEFIEELAAPYLQPMSCLLDVPAANRFVPGNGHYSPSGNAAVAKCFASQIRQQLATH